MLRQSFDHEIAAYHRNRQIILRKLVADGIAVGGQRHNDLFGIGLLETVRGNDHISVVADSCDSLIASGRNVVFAAVQVDFRGAALDGRDAPLL